MENFSFFSNNILGGDFITFKYRYRKQIILGIIILIIIGSITAFTVYKLKINKKKPKDEIVINKTKLEKSDKEEYIEKYQVDIKGEINSPGIYKVDINSRVMDVIMLAGGLTDNADTSVINLSKKVIDEMVIIVYSKDQVANFKEVKELEKQVNNKCLEPDENSLINNACIETNTNITSKISINNASLEELMTLTGIGESKAKEIISYREANGLFQQIEDITKVPGIGESLFAKIKENITL